MNKRIAIVTALLSLAVWVNPIVAAKPAIINLPPQAIQVAENVYYLGTAYDAASGLEVEGYAIVHKKAPTKGGNGAKPNKPGGSDSCYGFIAKGAKWKTIEPWVMNAANFDGLNETALFNIVGNGIDKWETAASNPNILGAGGLTTANLAADYGTLNENNEVYFGSLESGTIGVTVVWGYWSGPVGSRQIVEWDQVYNTNYSWSTTGASDKMDFDNIATHELGHAFGLADLYNSSCSTQTMYGYADFGETNKTTLESGDIAGINALY